jgi:phospholipid/cholesterol/gamma-HCH transport system substrate-binding protein
MRLGRKTTIQLAAFAGIAVVSIGVAVVSYMQIPTVFLGVGRYTVTVQLPQAANLYEGGNVTYHGVEVGRVQAVKLTDTGVAAVLQLKSGIDIPSADVTAAVHSVSAVGEQYVELTPHSPKGPRLKDGDVIPADRTSVPPNINSLLAAANSGLNAIPRDNLKTVVDESYLAVGGLGPDLSRLVDGTTALAISAHKNLDSLVKLIDDSNPVLDSQVQSSDSIQQWAAHLATITKQLQINDSSVRGLLKDGAPALDQVRQLVDRVEPTLPTLLANLVSLGQVAVTYRDNLEAVLVLVPQAVQDLQGIFLPYSGTKLGGFSLAADLNTNLPPPCNTGFYPMSQHRSSALVDSPERPPGLVYCRIPQDSQLNGVRGARNYPCETRPGKRAPTVKMCESNEDYVPLNDGFNWKGDANATFSGQSVPQFEPGEKPPPPSAPPGQALTGPPKPASPPPQASPAGPATAVVPYDPATYIGPDGQTSTQSNLANGAGKERTWQQMLTPPN